MTATNISLLALIVATIASLASVATFFRGQQWRNTDDGKAVNVKIAALREDVTVLRTKMEGLPSAADLERLAGKIDTVGAISTANHELLLDTRDGLKTLQRFFYEVRDK